MRIFSLFPQLLDFGFFAPLLLRIIVGLFVLYLGYRRYGGQYRWASILYLLSGGLLLLGIYTQLNAILGILILKFDIYTNFWKDRNTNPISVEKYFLYGMAGIILLSLLLTGPGAFAFDYPL